MPAMEQQCPRRSPSPVQMISTRPRASPRRHPLPPCPTRGRRPRHWWMPCSPSCAPTATWLTQPPCPPILVTRNCPCGSPEGAHLLQAIGEELSDALEESRVSILDLIER